MELAQLALFVRAPSAAAVKTRLRPALGGPGAVSLYSAFVEDTIALCNRVREAGQVDIALWADHAGEAMVSAWGKALGTPPQQQPIGDLGARLAATFEAGLRRYERVLVIGSDAPTLPFSHIVAAFDALEEASIVLGPSNDGGYYVIGATDRVFPRFNGVRWSTPSALRDTLEANRSHEIAILSPWYDVDEPSDLKILKAHLSADPASAPATAQCLAELEAAHR
jgi:rSAM/selenodomain-associated transferase 1